MASRHEQDFEDAVSADLLYQAGRSITHYPLNVVANAVAVTAVVDLSGLAADPQISDDGEKIIYSGSVTVSTDVSLDDRDTWLIDAVLWSTLGQVSQSGGLQTWHIQRAVQRSARSSTPRGS